MKPAQESASRAKASRTQPGDAKPKTVQVSFGADHIFVENEFRAPECARCVEWNIGYRCDHYYLAKMDLRTITAPETNAEFCAAVLAS